ncbi:hypothetical protein U1Q18_029879 [Sarracenia purpurea var. burkii]
MLCSPTLNPTISQCSWLADALSLSSTLCSANSLADIHRRCDFSRRRGDADALLIARLSPTSTICSAHYDFSVISQKNPTISQKNPAISLTDVGLAQLIVRLPSSMVEPRWPALFSETLVLN